MLEHSRLPLITWYLAMYWMTQSKTNIAALALMRHLGASWKTAWLLRHKLMEVMFQGEATRPLQGDVWGDDAYRGGELPGGGRGSGSLKRCHSWRRSKCPKYVRSDCALIRWPVFLCPQWRLGLGGRLRPAPALSRTACPVLPCSIGSAMSTIYAMPSRGKTGTEIDAFRWLNVVPAT